MLRQPRTKGTGSCAVQGTVLERLELVQARLLLPTQPRQEGVEWWGEGRRADNVAGSVSAWD